jgi:hypothetical protein
MGNECLRATRLLDEYLDGVLAPGRRSWLERHAASCPGCAAELQTRRRQFELLGGLQRFSPPEGFAARVAERVRAREPQPTVRPERARVWRWAPAASAAALLAVIAWIALRANAPTPKSFQGEGSYEQPSLTGQTPIVSVYRSEGARFETEGLFEEAVDSYDRAAQLENSRLASLDKARVLDKMGYQVAAAQTYLEFASSSFE